MTQTESREDAKAMLKQADEEYGAAINWAMAGNIKAAADFAESARQGVHQLAHLVVRGEHTPQIQ